MQCANIEQLKVCSSTTTATTADATSCGTYKFISIAVVQANTECTATQYAIYTNDEIQAVTASPFVLDMAAAWLISGAIIAVFATASISKWVDKAFFDNTAKET